MKPKGSQFSEFGLSDREQAEISGKATAGHLFEQVDSIAGGLREGHTMDAWSNAHSGWQGHDVRASDDDFPVYHHPSGATYPIGGPYVTHGENALYLDQEDRTPEGVDRRIQSWDADYGDE